MFQCYIVDDTYSIIAEINSVGGQGADLHEVSRIYASLRSQWNTKHCQQCNFPKDTNTSAMITVYNNIFPFDLTSVGGPKDGTLIDCLVQGKCQFLVTYRALVD